MYADEIRTAVVHDLLRALGVGSPPGCGGSVVQNGLRTIVRSQELTEPDGTRAEYHVVVEVSVSRLQRHG